MLSLKRLSYVLLIVLGICALFIIYNGNERNDTTLFIQKSEAEEKELLLAEEVLDKDKERCFYIVGDEEKEIYGDIYRNVCRLMSDWKVRFKKEKKLDLHGLQDDAVLIFCDDMIGEHVDLEQLASFIEKGGKMVLAAGIAEGYQDSYLIPVLGIVEKTTKENYHTFHFAKGFLPLQEDVMFYDGFQASTWLNVRPDATVYVEDHEKKVPIVYSYPFGKGETLVINATLLSDDRSIGILAAGLGSMLEEFLYPVVGTECVRLDNFPIVSYANDAVCMKLYGRTTEAFIRDVVWPVFQGMAVRHEIVYSSGQSGVLEQEHLGLPEATEGLDPEDGVMFAVSSILASHGMISHVFDMNHFNFESEEAATWNTDKYELEEFEKKIFSKTGYLQKMSFAETENMVNSYLGMNYTWERNNRMMEIMADHIVEGQPFFLRTEQKIENAEGAEYMKISDDYYIVRLHATKAVLTFQ